MSRLTSFIRWWALKFVVMINLFILISIAGFAEGGLLTKVSEIYICIALGTYIPVFLIAVSRAEDDQHE